MANRPNILALASKISLESMTYTGITYKDPEYRILEPIVDDDMCSVMMRMRLEKEFSAEELAKKCKKSVEYVQEQCDKLVAAGVIRVRYRGRQRGRGDRPRYRRAVAGHPPSMLRIYIPSSLGIHGSRTQSL